VLDRPQAPLNVSVRCRSTTLAEVDWWPGSDGNDHIISYTVLFSWSAPGAGGSYDAVQVAGNTTSTLLPVRPWLKYTVTVQARNGIGRSEVAEPVHCTTPQTAPSQHPRNVCTQTRLSHQLVIVWQVRTPSTLTFLLHISFTPTQCQRQGGRAGQLLLPLNFPLLENYIFLQKKNLFLSNFFPKIQYDTGNRHFGNLRATLKF